MTEIWAVIPAAGVGKRMQADRPKQYLEIENKTLLQHTIERMASHPRVDGVVVAVSPEDEYWGDLCLSLDIPLIKVDGGEERCHSVLNALNYLVQCDKSDVWVLVHDAARPCVRHADIDLLINTVLKKSNGGILGLPVSDTLKYCGPEQLIEKTVSRDHLWRALTPQMFLSGELYQAITKSLEDNYLVTDEASAIEHIGKKPCMVEGHPDNIKVTRPQDLALATLFLRQQYEQLEKQQQEQQQQ